MSTGKEIAEQVCAELARATDKFGSMASAHEGWAVIREEVDELWDEIKGGQDTNRMRDEAVQVAAMAMRFVLDVCDRADTSREDQERTDRALAKLGSVSGAGTE